ncbi:MAG: hypothetical protein ACK58T_12330, partial [Phycisphaerae bacterium]
MIDQIRSLGTDPDFVETVIDQIAEVATQELAGLREQERIAEREIRQCESVIQQLPTNSPDQTQRMAAAQERMRIATEQLSAIQQQIQNHDIEMPERAVVQLALQEFDPVWNALSPR